MKIAFFEIMEDERAFLKKSFPNDELVFFDGVLDEGQVSAVADAEVLSVFIYSKVDKGIIDKLPKLRLVTTRSMGFDHIDVAYAEKKNILVCAVPSYGERTVAEHAFALILALSRKIMAAYSRTEKSQFDYHGLTGFDLSGKTIGIIGGGKIGLNVAKIARNGFEMQVLVADPYPRPELAEQYGFRYVSLEELLGSSDVISLHAPCLPSTHHLINQENIRTIKRGAILVNTARGSLVDTLALLEGLEEGVLSGVGLDVLEEERFISEEKELIHGAALDKFNLAAIVENHMLINRDDVIVTPHIGFNSVEALHKILLTTCENVRAFEKGEPINLVKPKVC